MGYDLHITRRENSCDDNGKAILFGEWYQYVLSDDEIEQDVLNSENDFLFVNHPAQPMPMWWDDRGEIITKNPDMAMVLKMIEIAGRLQARVQGDEGELYTDADDVPE